MKTNPSIKKGQILSIKKARDPSNKNPNKKAKNEP